MRTYVLSLLSLFLTTSAFAQSSRHQEIQLHLAGRIDLKDYSGFLFDGAGGAYRLHLNRLNFGLQMQQLNAAQGYIENTYPQFTTVKRLYHRWSSATVSLDVGYNLLRTDKSFQLHAFSGMGYYKYDEQLVEMDRGINLALAEEAGYFWFVGLRPHYAFNKKWSVTAPIQFMPLSQSRYVEWRREGNELQQKANDKRINPLNGMLTFRIGVSYSFGHRGY